MKNERYEFGYRNAKWRINIRNQRISLSEPLYEPLVYIEQ